MIEEFKFKKKYWDEMYGPTYVNHFKREPNDLGDDSVCYTNSDYSSLEEDEIVYFPRELWAIMDKIVVLLDNNKVHKVQKKPTKGYAYEF
jgi:hypothetical protein